MDDNEVIPEETVRQQAERLVRLLPTDMETLTPEAQQAVLHELQVHQIKLEIQNEELRRVQIELEESRIRYFDLYDLAPVGYVTLNEFGMILEANLTFCDLLGVTRETVRKRPLTHFIRPADQDIFYRHNRQLMETGEPQTFQLCLRREEACVIWAQFRTTLLLGADNTPVCRATIGDITKNKQTEVALRESEEIFSQFMQHSPIYVFFKDKEIRSLKLSNNYEKMLGKPLPELLGKTMNDLFPSDLAKSMIADDQRILREGKPVEIEEELNGRLYTTIKFPIQSEGQVQYLAGYTIDITERKLAGDALRESHHALETALTDLQQTQAQLVQQERLAAVGQMAAGIAHDFNNILAVIKLYTELSLLSPTLPPAIHTNLTATAEQTDIAAHLVQQILDFGNRAILNPHTLALMPLLKKQISLWQRTLPASIKIMLTGEANDYIIYADETRIQQLFTNLVLNARDAMPQGGKLQLNLSHHRVDPLQIADPTVVVYPHLEAGDWVQITLSDSGTGIPPAALPHIFEPFFTTKKPGQGSGLGLAQVYGIVEKHKGHIDVQTEAGKGTTFTIYLPMQKMMASLGETAVPPKPKSPTGHGETILIVEDNAVLCEALEGALNSLNYLTMTANNGFEALAMLTEKDQAIAMVLSDLIMPEMGGIALLQAIREQGVTLPFVIMSGHPIETKINTLDEGALDGWLLKPVDLHGLATTIAQVLAKKA